MEKITRLLIAATFFISFLMSTTLVQAQEDMRVYQMRQYLTKVKSPMVGLESHLIATAENNGLDWTLLAAIAGTESTFGRRMPYQCINPYGWGIYGKNKLCFKSYEEAISKVGQGLSTKYNTKSVETIGRKYNTVSTAHWVSNTTFFMNKIKSQVVPVSQLPIEI